MKQIFFLFSFILMSCKSDFKILSVTTKEVVSTSIRTLNFDSEFVWFTGSGSKFGKWNYRNDSLEIFQIDDSKTEFRSSAIIKNNFFILSIENPAKLFKINKQNNFLETVYKEKGENVFYDSMTFFKNFGVAIGDPTDVCLSVLISENAGDTWEKLPCDILPKTEYGEAAFAASNTNVKVIDSTIFIISGGKKSRVFKSENRGKSWKVYNTPIIQGESMTGAFSMDFYNKNIGIIVGGNYDKPTHKMANKAITFNGGKTWEIVSDNKAFGYASCVQYMPNKKGKIIFSCGTSGVFYSLNYGKTWKKILDDQEYYTLRIKDFNTVFLAGKNKITTLKIE